MSAFILVRQNDLSHQLSVVKTFETATICATLGIRYPCTPINLSTHVGLPANTANHPSYAAADSAKSRQPIHDSCSCHRSAAALVACYDTITDASYWHN